MQGESVGISAFSYSFGPNNYYFTLQGKQTTEIAQSGWTFTGPGYVSLGCRQPWSNNRTVGLASMGFYELIVYDEALSVFTQRSLVRSFYSSKLNQQSKLKKWPLTSYSVRKLNSTYYNGPLFRVRRLDQRVADVYCDEFGVERAIYDLNSSTNFTSMETMWNWTAWSNVYL